ncbi:uncharacterized protein LOC120725057 [Simochromis diagramma]|uniref:uncharacterized protein LOC120725057 n=1 Tax=Simochromis diagramma TaxID=43689 RepID=UPI001A7E82C2|nr:uncharacterized protein LOC120725057 [Simochromis diagramma]
MIDLSVINSEESATTKSTTSLTTASNNQSADSGKDSEIATSTTVKFTTRKSTTEPTNIWTTKEEVKTSEGTLTPNNQPHVQSGFIIVPVGLVTLLIIVVVITRWKKIKVNKAQQSDNMADADDGVSYVSISFTKKSKNKSKACGDDGDTVTYSTMKVPSSPAGLSTDPSDLYSTINKPKK